MGHEDILIRHNTVVDWESVGIGVHNARRVVIEENQLVGRSKTGFFLSRSFGILVGANTAAVRVEGNRFTDPRQFTPVHINVVATEVSKMSHRITDLPADRWCESTCEFFVDA